MRSLIVFVLVFLTDGYHTWLQPNSAYCIVLHSLRRGWANMGNGGLAFKERRRKCQLYV